MAYKNCAAQIAANIAQDCNRPLVGGYTGRAVIIPASDWARAEVVADASNPRKIMSIVLPPDGSAMAYTIDNVFATPFTGSTTAGNTDSGRNGYLKTIAVRVPMRGADVSKDVIEPLVKDADGFVVIAEKRDKVGDGSYEVIGCQNALRGDIASVTRDENANGGDWIVNLTTIEKWAEVTLVGSADNYESAKKEFEGLFGYEPPVVLIKNIGGYSEFDVVTSVGDVVLEYVKNGQIVRTNVGELDQDSIAIDADANTDAKIYGYITFLQEYSLTCDSIELLGQKYIETLELYDSTIAVIHTTSAIQLKQLDARHITGLTSLDVSKNTALTNLNCEGCTGLTSLDVSKNTALTHLYCVGCTGLTSLDLSKNTALNVLDFVDCSQIGMLNVSNLTECSYPGHMPNKDVLSTILVTGSPNVAIQSVMEEWFDSEDTTATGMLYVDENTQQSLIDAATDKGWEIVY